MSLKDAWSDESIDDIRLTSADPPGQAAIQRKAQAQLESTPPGGNYAYGLKAERNPRQNKVQHLNGKFADGRGSNFPSKGLISDRGRQQMGGDSLQNVKAAPLLSIDPKQQPLPPPGTTTNMKRGNISLVPTAKRSESISINDSFRGGKLLTKPLDVIEQRNTNTVVDKSNENRNPVMSQFKGNKKANMTKGTVSARIEPAVKKGRYSDARLVPKQQVTQSRAAMLSEYSVSKELEDIPKCAAAAKGVDKIKALRVYVGTECLTDGQPPWQLSIHIDPDVSSSVIRIMSVDEDNMLAANKRTNDYKCPPFVAKSRSVTISFPDIRRVQ